MSLSVAWTRRQKTNDVVVQFSNLAFWYFFLEAIPLNGYNISIVLRFLLDRFSSAPLICHSASTTNRFDCLSTRIMDDDQQSFVFEEEDHLIIACSFIWPGRRSTDRHDPSPYNHPLLIPLSSCCLNNNGGSTIIIILAKTPSVLGLWDWVKEGSIIHPVHNPSRC